MSGEEDKSRGVAVDHQYGTFQGVNTYPTPTYPPPHPPLPSHHQQPHQHAIGFPQPIPPPGVYDHSSSSPQYYSHGYQTVPGYAVAEGRPVRERRLPCCGLGFGWFLFIFGFFFAAIPWYLGLFIILCARVDHREKPGYVACTIAAVLATIAILLGATKGAHDW